MLLTPTIICSCNINSRCAADVIKFINDYSVEYQINTPLRLAHFMTQVCFESNGFKTNEESFTYPSPASLMQVWPKRFPDAQIARQFVQSPQKLANYVYANTMGNGDPTSGDGYRYRGRGPLHTTGKFNYAKLSKKLFNNDMLIKKPELLADLKYGLKAAFLQWSELDCNTPADKDNVAEITRRLRGRTADLAERKRWLQIWKEKLFIT